MKCPQMCACCKGWHDAAGDCSGCTSRAREVTVSWSLWLTAIMTQVHNLLLATFRERRGRVQLLTVPLEIGFALLRFFAWPEPGKNRTGPVCRCGCICGCGCSCWCGCRCKCGCRCRCRCGCRCRCCPVGVGASVNVPYKCATLKTYVSRSEKGSRSLQSQRHRVEERRQSSCCYITRVNSRLI